jgi:hypothetical protein
MNFPPYLPGLMQLFSNWTNPEEIICSDMPWAIAWYADRKALLLPAKVKEFDNYYDYQTLGGPIVGLYLSSISSDAGFGPMESGGRKAARRAKGQLVSCPRIA